MQWPPSAEWRQDVQVYWYSYAFLLGLGRCMLQAVTVVFLSTDVRQVHYVARDCTSSFYEYEAGPLWYM